MDDGPEMNFVRRRPTNNNDREVPSGVSPECTHLSRLFNQYKQIQDHAEQEQMFYELLPLFHGVIMVLYTDFFRCWQIASQRSL